MNHGLQPARRNLARRTGVRLVMLDAVASPQSSFSSLLSGRRNLGFMCVLLCAISGCKNPPPASTPTPSRAEVRQERQAAQSRMEAARQELEQIPPPSKNRYLSVHNKDAYANPFLVIHPQTITLTIIYRDQDPNGFDAGGMLRPAKARRQELDIRPADLPRALSSLAPDAWPYGRVVAIEESRFAGTSKPPSPS
jgi:hypothetical protein